MFNAVGQFLFGLGPLRWMLYSAVLVTTLFRPAPGSESVYEGWAVFPTLLFPALAPILFMLLLL
ncbi:MAG: hypothetical protein OEY07_19435, partial [Gammaproteobacteria bacterium]|nr:hypothetical protein [Gammaproteobacteria bacterium]